MRKKLVAIPIIILLVFINISAFAAEPDTIVQETQDAKSFQDLQTSISNIISECQKEVIDQAEEELAIEEKLSSSGYLFPIIKNGDTLSEELYQKYSDGQYCAEVFAFYALHKGWSYNAVVGALAYMWVEGMGTNGTFTYEGCWSVRGPSGSKYDKTLDNNAWRSWINSSDCASQMINHTSWYSSGHYAFGLGYCAESSVWDGGSKSLDLCDKYLDAADEAGVAWQDINFQTNRALDFLTSPTAQADPDWRNPTTFEGTAEEYCARVFATNGYPAFSVWHENGQLQAHLNAVNTVKPFVDNVVNENSKILNDVNK